MALPTFPDLPLTVVPGVTAGHNLDHIEIAAYLASLRDEVNAGSTATAAEVTARAAAITALSGTYVARADVVDARTYAADGVTVDNAAITAAITAAAGRPIYLHGSISVGTGFSYTGTAAVNLFGLPGQTVLTGTGNDVISLTGVSSSDVRIEDLAVVGSGTSASSSGAVLSGIRVEGRTGPVRINNVKVSGFCNGFGVRVVGGADVVVERSRFSNGFDTLVTKSSYGAIYVTGSVVGVTIRDNVVTGPVTNPQAIGIFVVGYEPSSWVVKNIVVSGNRVSGMSRCGISVTHESSLAVFNTGQMTITDNIVENCIEQGIKIKIAKRVHIANNTIVGCNTVSELAGQLDGGINVQSSSETTITGNTIINDGTEGIRVDVKQLGAADGDEGTLGRSNHTITGNTILSCALAGIRVGASAYDLAITGNTIVSSGLSGIYLYPSTPTPTSDAKIRRIAVTGNVVRKSGTNGIQVVGADDVNITGNIVTKAQNYGIIVDAGFGFVICGNTISDSGQSGSNTSGIRVGTTSTGPVVITGNSSGNRETTSQTYGVSLAAVAVVGMNTLDHNTSGRVQTPSFGRHQFLDAVMGAKPAAPGTAAGTDAAVVNALVTGLRTLGLIT